MVTTRLVTAQELAAMRDDDVVRELIEGEILEVSPTGIYHGEITSALVEALILYSAEHRQIRVRVGEVGYLFAREPDTVLVPDISILTADQFESMPRRSNRFSEIVPTIAVEVKSPSNREADIAKKLSIYLAAGVQEIWWVRPDDEQISVHTPEASPVLLGFADSLVSPKLLPGFELSLFSLFRIG
jgi:Uma2 family endonuclease